MNTLSVCAMQVSTALTLSGKDRKNCSVSKKTVFQKVCDCSVSFFKEPSHSVNMVLSCGNQGHEVGSHFFPACSKYTTAHCKQVAAIALAAVGQGPSTGQVIFVCAPASGVGCHYIHEDEETDCRRTENICLCSRGRKGQSGASDPGLPNSAPSVFFLDWL